MRVTTLLILITLLSTSAMRGSTDFRDVPCFRCVPWFDPFKPEPRNTPKAPDKKEGDVVDSDTIFREVTRRPVRPDNSAKIEALLRRMTIEEKIGQMTQLTIDMVTTGDDQDVKIDETKLRKAIVQYGVGSILNVNNQALTVDHWHRIIGPIQQAAQTTRLKIPVIYGVDSIHGANYVQGSTLFPQEIGMAATWNPALMRRAAEIAAMETRAAGVTWSFSPVLDVGRNQAWPRFWETFGEDPYLATVMGTAFVRGLRSTYLGYFDLENKFVIEPGDFTIMIGGQSAKLTIR